MYDAGAKLRPATCFAGAKQKHGRAHRSFGVLREVLTSFFIGGARGYRAGRIPLLSAQLSGQLDTTLSFIHSTETPRGLGSTPKRIRSDRNPLYGEGDR